MVKGASDIAQDALESMHVRLSRVIHEETYLLNRKHNIQTSKCKALQ